MSIREITDPPLRSQGLSQADYSAQFEAFMTSLPLAVDDFNAAASAFQLAVTGTSTSSVAIGTGSKSFTTQTGLGFVVGMTLRLAFDSTNYMTGDVTSYNSGSGALVVNVTAVVGSGTRATWTISLAAVGANTAGAVSFTPTGNIAATNVQTAIAELDTEKLSSAAGAVTGTNLEDITTAETVGSSFVIPVVTKDVNGRVTGMTTAAKISSSAPVATTSGTSINVASSISASAKRVVLSLSGVSINAADNIVFRLNGVSTGYGSSSQQSTAAAVATVAEATGFRVTTNAPIAATAVSGHATFVLHDATNFIYTYSIMVGNSAAATMYYGAGTVTLTGLLTTIAITTLAASTFDAGSVTPFVE